MTKQRTKRPSSQDGDMRVDLTKEIAAAREALRKALIAGDKTAGLHEYLRELEAKMREYLTADANQKADQEAAREAVQRAEYEEHRQRVADAAQLLADARENRIAVLALRYAIPERLISVASSSLNA
ncbi:hypothetical protein [Paraburkholderia tropica]|uniref:hypothetical protein n=1 Tax=Paraburkholderia tropica TaxID=92647 RepID=UPI002AB03D9F|nr:hypothetical protein [Paraburkholderia tropica]